MSRLFIIGERAAGIDGGLEQYHIGLDQMQQGTIVLVRNRSESTFGRREMTNGQSRDHAIGTKLDSVSNQNRLQNQNLTSSSMSPVLLLSLSIFP